LKGLWRENNFAGIRRHNLSSLDKNDSGDQAEARESFYKPSGKTKEYD
jgi:hypothetical protein